MAKQTLLAFGANSGGYAVTILTGIVVARTLGPAGKGVAAYAALVMALCTALGGGLQSALMTRCSARRDDLPRAYGSAVRLLGMFMVPVALLPALAAVLDSRYAALAYAAIAIPFAVYGQIANAVFLLHNDVRATVIQNSIPAFGAALFTIPALTVFHGGLTAVLTIWAATFVCAGCFAAIRVSAYVPVIPISTSARFAGEQARFALKAGLAAAASFLNLRVDVFIVGLLLDVRTLGVYTLAVAGGELLWLFSRPLVLSTIGRIAAAERGTAIALTCKTTRCILALECVLGIAAFAIAPVAINAIYGPAYAGAATIVRCLLAGQVLYAVQAPIAFFITVKEGRPTRVLAIQLASLAACATISLLTIPALNVFGPALATTLTYSCGALAIALTFTTATGVPIGRLLVPQSEDLDRIRAAFEGFRSPREARAGA